MKNAKRRQRLRSTCKWGGVTLCVLLFALWLASGWWFLSAHRQFGPREVYTRAVWIDEGRFIFIDAVPSNGSNVEWYFRCARRYEDNQHPASWLWRFEFPDEPGWRFYAAPLWFPFLIIALPTGYLFWSDHRRRMRAGCCGKCGYDLKGNVSGKCPECGATTAKAASL